MNRGFIVFCLCAVFIIVSCGKQVKKKVAPIRYQETLIHPLFFQTEIANNLTFAFWFNDSIAKKNKLKIIRFKYLEGSTYGVEESTRFPKKIVNYVLNQDGDVIHIQESTYSEGIVISTVSYWFKCKKNSAYFYAKLDTNVLENYNPRYHKSILDPIKIAKKYFIFKNRNTEVKVHYLFDPKLQKPLAIEQNFHPTASDWIVLGRPSRPIKRYQVFNTVKEKNVVNYSYVHKNLPKRIQRSNYPFNYVRNFTYENGKFVGFLDSTFIDDSFVTSEKTTIIYNKSNLPQKINRKKEHEASEIKSEFSIIMEYEYWNN